MKTRMMPVLLIVLLLSISLGTALAEDTIIKISPDILVIHSEQQRQWLTVHTNIAYSSVIADSVTLHIPDDLIGIPISWWKADDQGNFVAKFVMTDVEDYVKTLGKKVDLTLVGNTVGGETFAGTDSVLVMMTTCKKELVASFTMGRRVGSRSSLFSKVCGPD